jgi:hypothetical protein
MRITGGRDGRGSVRDRPGGAAGTLQSRSMPSPSSPASPSVPHWSLGGTVVTCARTPFAATLDLATPEHGLSIDGPDAVGDHLLGLDIGASAAPSDHWLRGRDITAVYEPADDRRLRATAMWRRLDDHPGGIAWEVVVSAQTALLEAMADVAVVSSAAADRVAWAGADSRWQHAATGDSIPDTATRILLRRRRSSLLVAVHPADARGIVVATANDRARVACRLFAAALEKGVLLRSRVLAAIGPAADDEAWAARLGDAFAASPAPLTT